jgi:hypothetical protein
MKQTAVEWMFEQFFKVKWGSMKGNMPTIFEEAKEMEKEQIRNAYNDGYFAAYKYKDWEEYYKQNFNQNK